MDVSVLLSVIGGIIIVTYIIVQLLKGKCYSKASLEGKTTLITGANTGIGYATAVDFAKRNGRVILACRNKKRAEEARRNIISETGNQNIVVKIVDVSCMASIREFVKDFLEEEKRLDILVNNAAVTGLYKTMTEEGLEYTYATNYIGPFLLTNLLLDLLKETPKSRIVNVSSIVNMFGSVNYNMLNGENYGVATAYYNTKLLNVLFTKELARRLSGTGVTTYCLHPGYVVSDLLRHTPFFIRLPLTAVAYIFHKNCNEGAQTTIYCAVSEELEGVSGRYYMDCKDYENTIYISKQAYDEGLCKKIWEVTETLVELK